MNYKGVFFDGHSSIPYEVTVKFDQLNKSLIIETISYEVYNWEIDLININKIDNCLILSYENENIQSLKIEDTDSILKFEQFLNEYGKSDFYSKLVNKKIHTHIIIAIFLLGLIALSYLYILPYVAEKAVYIIPEEFDNKIGDIFIDEFLRYNDIDSSKTEYLNQYINQIDLNNSKPIKVIAIKSQITNAFALPNGTIVIYTSLLNSIQNHEELAGLISHEIAHINNRHSMKMMCRNLSGYLFISVVLSDINGIMAIIGDNIHNLQSLTYSRNYETEADENGIEIMIKNNINISGMTSLFERLKKENNNKYIPEILSTHPDIDNRIIHINSIYKAENYITNTNKDLIKIFNKIKN